MSEKQDRQGVRTAADLERKYRFGETFAEFLGIAEDAKKSANEAKDAVGDLDKELTPEEIFNRLTDNGKIQGIYRGDDGQVYINASYILTGELVADLIKSGTLDAAKVTIANLVADTLKSIDGNVGVFIDGARIRLSYNAPWEQGPYVDAVSIWNYGGNDNSVNPIAYFKDWVKNTSTGYMEEENVTEISPHHFRCGGKQNYPLFEVSTSSGVSKMTVDVINKGKTTLFTGSVSQNGTCTVDNTANYDLFAVYLGDGTTAENTAVLCYKTGSYLRGIGGRAGDASTYRELHFFEATISGNTWTVKDARKQSVYDGSLSSSTQLKLMKVVGVI